MKCYVIDRSGRPTGEIIDRAPRCCEDFCESCGDCLVCFSECRCMCSADGSHYFTVSEDDLKP
jgi:hypothetical protein